MPKKRKPKPKSLKKRSAERPTVKSEKKSVLRLLKLLAYSNSVKRKLCVARKKERLQLRLYLPLSGLPWETHGGAAAHRLRQPPHALELVHLVPHRKVLHWFSGLARHCLHRTPIAEVDGERGKLPKQAVALQPLLIPRVTLQMESLRPRNHQGVMRMDFKRSLASAKYGALNAVEVPSLELRTFPMRTLNLMVAIKFFPGQF